MMGHSRGGDGVRAAYNDYIAAGSIWPGMIEDPVTFKGVFEIAPVDFLGNNSKGVAWNIIAGMCDGDVFDLEGIPSLRSRHPAALRVAADCRNRRSSSGAPTTTSSTRSGRSATATDLQPPNFPAICTGSGQRRHLFPCRPARRSSG